MRSIFEILCLLSTADNSVPVFPWSTWGWFQCGQQRSSVLQKWRYWVKLEIFKLQRLADALRLLRTISLLQKCRHRIKTKNWRSYTLKLYTVSKLTSLYKSVSLFTVRNSPSLTCSRSRRTKVKRLLMMARCSISWSCSGWNNIDDWRRLNKKRVTLLTVSSAGRKNG